MSNNEVQTRSGSKSNAQVRREARIMNTVEDRKADVTVVTHDTNLEDSFVPLSTLYYQNLAPVERKGYDLKFGVPSGPDNHPTEFNWANASDVATKRFENKITETRAASLISPVVDQGRCGSCWAVSTASMFSDRVSIALLQRNVNFSATELLSCVSAKRKLKINAQNKTRHVTISSLECCGGFPIDACNHIETYGIGLTVDNPYDTWCCHGVLVCDITSNKDVDEMDPPPCQVKSKTRVPPGLRVKAKPNSTRTVLGVENIKEAIYHEGPVVGAYVVYSDFEYTTVSPSSNSLNQSAEDNKENKTSWLRSGPGLGIYVKDERTPAEGGPSIQGGHAVVIVGWGVATGVPQPYWWNQVAAKRRQAAQNKRVRQHTDTVKGNVTVSFDDVEAPSIWNSVVPYWVVRNSWGAQWGDKGYFRMAMNLDPLNLNSECGLDIPTPANNIGGTTMCLPNVDYDPIHALVSVRPFDIHNIEQSQTVLATVPEIGEMLQKSDITKLAMAIGIPVGVALLVFLLVWFLYIVPRRQR